MRFSRISVALYLAAATATAQQAAYTPATVMPNGKEVVAVYIGAQSCGPCHAPAVKDAVRQMKKLVAAQAHQSGAAFSVMGVANDWDLTVAATFLSDIGPFDQLVLGGNWTNIAIEHFVWRQPDGNAAMPQILVLERTVTAGQRVSFSEPRVLRRLVGADEIPAWVANGAPISAPTGRDKG